MGAIGSPIVVGYVDTPEGEAALDRAVARGAAARRPPRRHQLAQGRREPRQGERRGRVDESSTGVHAQLHEAGVEHEVRQLVRGLEPADDLIAVAEEVDADLIVIGLRRRTPVGKLILGSNAQQILLEAPLPRPRRQGLTGPATAPARRLGGRTATTVARMTSTPPAPRRPCSCASTPTVTRCSHATRSPCSSGCCSTSRCPMERAFLGPGAARRADGHPRPPRRARRSRPTTRRSSPRSWRRPPAVHRFPGSMAGRVQALARARRRRVRRRRRGDLAHGRPPARRCYDRLRGAARLRRPEGADLRRPARQAARRAARGAGARPRGPTATHGSPPLGGRRRRRRKPPGGPGVQAGGEGRAAPRPTPPPGAAGARGPGSPVRGADGMCTMSTGAPDCATPRRAVRQ